MAAEFERLAFEAALRGLEKQEDLLSELRARTGLLLAASSLAASFLGQQAFQDPHPAALALIALAAFVISIVASVYILLPKKDLIFSESGTGLYEGLYELRDDLAEVYRRLAYDLERFWESNDPRMQTMTRTYALAAVALVVEILSLAALLSGTILEACPAHRNPRAPRPRPRRPLRVSENPKRAGLGAAGSSSTPLPPARGP